MALSVIGIDTSDGEIKFSIASELNRKIINIKAHKAITVLVAFICIFDELVGNVM